MSLIASGFYAAPHKLADVRLPLLLARLAETAVLGCRISGRPTRAESAHRTRSGGVIAHEGTRDLCAAWRAFMLRATGSAELLDGGLTALLSDGPTVFLRATLNSGFAGEVGWVVRATGLVRVKS